MGETAPAERLTVTPAVAHRWLETNQRNRALRPARIARMAEDMRQSRWLFTGETIKFDTEGHLVDGQHRLRACIDAGRPFETLVVRGISEEAITDIDSGATRMLRDVLRISRGVADASGTASAVNFCWRYENDLLLTPIQPSRAEALAWFDANPRIPESIAKTHSARQKLRIPPTVAGGVHYLASRMDSVEADGFFFSLREGVGLDPGSPVLALRKWLENVRGKRDRPSTIVYAAFTIKALNFWRAGRTVQLLTWRRGGLVGEPFPRLIAPTDLSTEEDEDGS